MTIAAAARRSQAVGTLARGLERYSAERPSQAEHWHVYGVPVDADVLVKLYATQDSDGRWYGSDSVEFGTTLNQDLPSRSAVLVPSVAEKWDTEVEALNKRCELIRLWCEANQPGWDGDELEALELLGDTVQAWARDVQKHVAAKFAEEAKQTKAAKANGQAKARDASARRKTTGGLTPAARQREIVQVPLDKIHRHPHNRTIVPASCEGLADSLRRRGLLSPVRVRAPGEHWMLPEGHLQLIDGERRLVAARLAGWDVIDAVVVEISDAEAEAEIAASNGQRTALNEIEIADRLAHLQRPVEEGGGGLTQTQAAAEMGISQSYASLLQSVAALPACWRDAVIAGEIPGSFLRPVAKYSGCPEILDLLWDDYQHVAKWNADREDWQDEGWLTRLQVENTVLDVIANKTRPATPADQLDDRDWYEPRFDVESLPAKDLRGLQVVELPGDAGPLRRCLNVKRWIDLQTAAAKAGQGKGGGNGVAKKTKPKAAKPQRTPAEQRKLDADADKKLRERITARGGLAEIALRIDLAKRLKAGDCVTNNLHDDLVALSRNAQFNSTLDYDDWKHLAERLVIADRLPKDQSPPQISGHRTAEAYQRYSEHAIDWENDPATDGDRRRWYVCRLLLWPYSEVIEERGKLAKRGEWPERFPWCESSTLELYAKITGATVRSTWMEAREKKGAARLWFEQFIRTHITARQRQALCTELGVLFEKADKLATLEQRIVAAHEEKALPLPAVLAPKAAKGKKGGGK